MASTTSTRRDFLAGAAATAAGAAGLSLTGSFARTASAGPEAEIVVKPCTVVIFLRGGQDALNTCVPWADGTYYDMRPNIGVPPPDKPGGALALDGTFGLHPSLGGFKRLWDQGLLVPVVNAGSPHPSRSHFECQDFLDYGTAGDRSVHDGWLNRYLSATAGPGGAGSEFRALAMQGRLPRSLRGAYPVLAVPDRLDFGGSRGEDTDVLDLFDPLYKSPPSMERPGTMGERTDADTLTQNGRTTIDVLRRLEEIVSRKAPGTEAVYPASAGRLGQQLKRTARVLKAGQGLECVGIDWNGWDHHINEGGPQEQDLISRMLAQLGSAVETFFEDVKDMRNQVTLLVLTEFGRTNEENGNRGTDHGRGSVMFVAGGRVKGKKVYGEWAPLAGGGRDLPVTTDFRSVYSEVLHGPMRLHPSKQLFPKFTPKPVGLF
jgi:uncharacterized protein (DUF1501 family)